MASWTQTMSGRSNYYITLTAWEVSYDISRNSSIVHWKLEATKSSGSGFYSNDAKNPMHTVLDGTTDGWNVTYDFRNQTPKTLLFLEAEREIFHNEDGTKTVSLEGFFQDKANDLGSATVTGSLTLTPIPRHFSQTPVVNATSSTTTSATFSWSTSETCSAVKYILDGGGETSVWTGSATSGTFTINGLTANTSHTIKINAQRKDSGYWSYSAQKSFSTSAKTVRVRINGAWKDATPYVRVNGQWKVAVPYTRVSGQWKKGK